MIKRSYFFAAVLALMYVTVASAQHPVLDAVANKVVAKYQSSTCEQLMHVESPESTAVPGRAESHGDAAN